MKMQAAVAAVSFLLFFFSFGKSQPKGAKEREKYSAPYKYRVLWPCSPDAAFPTKSPAKARLLQLGLPTSRWGLICQWPKLVPLQKMAPWESGFDGVISPWGPSPPQTPLFPGITTKSALISQQGIGSTMCGSSCPILVMILCSIL